MSISLEASLRTCKVDTGWASKVQSDRFLNPSLMVCPTWNGYDSAGRPVAADSFMTKRAGCNSAMDRVSVENNVSRPQYIEYINLNAAGIDGDIYGPGPASGNAIQARRQQQVSAVTGQFGNTVAHGNGLAVQSSCQSGATNNNLHLPYDNPNQFLTSYAQAERNMSQNRRAEESANNRFYSQQNQACGGN